MWLENVPELYGFECAQPSARLSAATDTNFIDLDALVVGPAVRQAEAIFDEFWNGNAAIPLQALKQAKPGAVERLRAQMAEADRRLSFPLKRA